MAQAGVSGRYFTLLCNLHLSLYDVVCGIMERVRRQASLSGDWNLMFSVFFHAIRMTWRDWRAGEWRFLLVAMAIAVAALSSVSFFVDRMRASLQGEAAVLLGADMQVVSDRAFDQVWYDKAKTYGLSFAETRQFPTMALPDALPALSACCSEASSESFWTLPRTARQFSVPRLLSYCSSSTHFNSINLP